MSAPKGFGKTYFSLVAIQAYASEIRLMQNVTRIAWICPTHPIHTYSTVSPPKSVLLSSIITTLFQGHLCLNQPYRLSSVQALSPQ
ncbi:MAG: hypothetical protein Q8O20_03065 [Sulfuricurvum sp.]|uniref:hypothetical protein n=1 Tax=Sulfuricurvum sp. TaxID=2025608 RepID=UPI0027322EE0|nr:hypothetical protein [Sulfuricurvum sp.]MDP2850030.1 hypothetical protein [Sulfuricurvum sp.]